MKSRLEKVYSKLPNQKIDLSSVSELERASDMLTIDTTNLNELRDVQDNLQEFNLRFDAIQSLAEEFVNQYEYIRDAYYDMPNPSQIDTILNEFAINAEALGLEPKSVDIFNVLEEQYTEILDFSLSVEDFIDNNIGEYQTAKSIIS